MLEIHHLLNDNKRFDEGCNKASQSGQILAWSFCDAIKHIEGELDNYKRRSFTLNHNVIGNISDSHYQN